MASQAFMEITRPVLPGIEVKEPKEPPKEKEKPKTRKKTVKVALPKSK
jgi:hypothetical protein